MSDRNLSDLLQAFELLANIEERTGEQAPGLQGVWDALAKITHPFDPSLVTIYLDEAAGLWRWRP